MTRYDQKFRDLCKRYGFRIRKVPFQNDIYSVRYRGHHLMTIPRRIYGEVNIFYRDKYNHIHPHFNDRERKVKEWNIRIKRSRYIEDYERDFPWKPFYKPL